MKKKYLLFFAGFLLALNIFVWKEVFVLAEPRYLKVDFLSVGQGDSEFITTPESHQILIDGGPSSAVLQKLAERMPFWDKTIDVVILTHPEKDHMLGILEVLQKYKIDYFLWSGILKDNAENKKLAELLEKAENPENNFLASLAGQNSATRVVAVSAGQKIKAGDVLIDILYPLENLAGEKLGDNASANDTCVVNKITYGQNSFLFTGDIDFTIENEIISKENADSDVLKVGHHGSKYSTSDDFLQAVSPEIAVIEVGKNSYGHPTGEVLQRLENFGIKVKRTDQDGDVEIVSDGNKIYLK